MISYISHYSHNCQPAVTIAITFSIKNKVFNKNIHTIEEKSIILINVKIFEIKTNKTKSNEQKRDNIQLNVNVSKH